MIINAKYGSHHFSGYEKMQFDHFPIISLWELSVAMQPTQEPDHHNFNYFLIPPTKATFLQN